MINFRERPILVILLHKSNRYLYFAKEGQSNSMKIHIENFRNIESLDCEIEDNKVNFIYGISGTGKSSLVKAVSQAPGKKDAPIGKPGLTPNVTLNGGAPNYASVRVYNEESVMSLILNPIENENAYSALVGDESELIKL